MTDDAAGIEPQDPAELSRQERQRFARREVERDAREAVLEQRQSELEAANASLRHERAELRALADRLGDDEAVLSDQNARLSEEALQLRAENARLADAHGILRIQQERLAELNKRLEGRTQDLSGSQTAVQRQNTRLLESQVDLQRQNTRLTEAQAELQAQNLALSEALDLLEAQNNALAYAQAELEAQNRQLGEARAELEAQNAQLEHDRQQLGAAEERLRGILLAMQEGLVIQQAGTGAITMWNPAAEEILGLTGDQLSGRSSFDPAWRTITLDGEPFPPDCHPAMVTLATGQPADAVFGVHRPDGTCRWIHASAVPVRAHDGSVEASATTFADVTTMHEMQEALADREAHFRLLATGTQEVISLVGLDGRYQWVSPSIERHSGWNPEQLIGERAADYVHPEDLAIVNDAAHRQRVSTTGEVTPVTLRVRTRDGQYRWVETTSTPVLDDAGTPTGLLTVSRDITERRVMEQRLQQAERLEALGTMAGGIAHDFNNLLVVIKGTAELMAEDLAPGARLQGDVQAILTAAERGQVLTQQLLAFTRRQVVQAVPKALDEVVRSAMPLLKRLVKTPNQLQVRLRAPRAVVTVSPTEFDTALLNLVTNARDAMSADGVVVVDTGLVTLDESNGVVPAGRWAQVTIRDTGSGMTPEVLKHAFDPFFTTKDVGQGTGLGLSTVYSTMQRVGGAATIVSTPGFGTSVTLWFPCTEADAEVAAAEPEAPVAVADRTRPVVLVVDDEVGVRTLAVRALARSGFDTEEAGNGAEALALLDAHADRFAAVLTDFAMPEVNGRELIDRVRAQWPDLKPILMSGYTSNAETREWLAAGAVPFLAKPFNISDLVAVVRERVTAP